VLRRAARRLLRCAIVSTWPTDHGKDVQALYDDPEAMGVHPWWASTICTFKDFADGRNPYEEAVRPLTKLVIRRSASANATPPLSKEFETALGEVIDGFVKGNERMLAARAKSNKEKAERIGDAGEKVEQCERCVENIRETLANLPDDPKDDTKEQKLEREQAEQELEEAREAMRGVFGSSGDIWNRTEIKDDRTQEELFGTLDRALERGGIKQPEAEMEQVDDDDFLNHFARDPKTMHAVLGSGASSPPPPLARGEHQRLERGSSWRQPLPADSHHSERQSVHQGAWLAIIVSLISAGAGALAHEPFPLAAKLGRVDPVPPRMDFLRVMGLSRDVSTQPCFPIRVPSVTMTLLQSGCFGSVCPVISTRVLRASDASRLPPPARSISRAPVRATNWVEAIGSASRAVC
jgi:hypothetical protein